MHVISGMMRNFTSNWAKNSKFRRELQVTRVVYRRASQILRAELSSRRVRNNVQLNLSNTSASPHPLFLPWDSSTASGLASGTLHPS